MPPKYEKKAKYVMESFFGIDDDEILACTSSTDPNDMAFMASMAALIRAWRNGDAMAYRNAARAIVNGQRVVSERSLEPSAN